MNIEELIENFEFLEDWEERYSYIIELGKKLPIMPEELKNDENLVEGCTSRVWVKASAEDGKVNFLADSDAHIVRGLIAVLMTIFSGKTAADIKQTDAVKILKELELDEHLSPSRKNGLYSMVERINREAELLS